MKTIFLKLGFVVSLLLMIRCSDDNEDKGNRPLTVTEKNSLVFMLEEEKLARDTYRYLDNLNVTYIPQYLTEADFNTIITSNHEQCN